jgi:ankyrin repeat protein
MPNRVGANGARIVPGNSEGESPLPAHLGHTAGSADAADRCAAPDAIRTIKLWIEQGADWPDELAGETPSPPQDPVATTLLDAIRRGDRASVARLLKQSPDAARAKESADHAADVRGALSRHATARLLLDAGADLNARNDAGATALMWAVDDLEMTRLLLERKADPNVRSADGRSALMLAAGRSGASDVVKAAARRRSDGRRSGPVDAGRRRRRSRDHASAPRSRRGEWSDARRSRDALWMR